MFWTDIDTLHSQKERQWQVITVPLKKNDKKIPAHPENEDTGLKDFSDKLERLSLFYSAHVS